MSSSSSTEHSEKDVVALRGPSADKQTSSDVAITKDTERLVDESMALQKRLLTPLFGKNVPPIPLEDERKPYPRYKSNIIARAFFWWLHPVMNTGYKRTLQPNDLWYLEGDLLIEQYFAVFEQKLEKQLAASKAEHELVVAKKKEDGTYNSEEDDEFTYPKYSLVWALWYTFKFDYSKALMFNIMANLCFVLNPLLTKALINFVENRALGLNPLIGKGVGYAIGVSAMVFAPGVLINHFMHNSMMVGAKVKAVLTKAILEKSFRLNAKGKQRFPVGKITSIMGTDLARIDLALGFLPFGITFPVPVIIAIALLIVNIGVASLVGIAVFVVALVSIALSTRSLFAFRKSAIKFTDLRVAYMKELLNNLKIIKFYSWEDSYGKAISDTRTKEMNIVFKMQFARGLITAAAICLSQLSSMVAFLVMYAISTTKNAADIFSSISFFNMLAQQMMMVPMALASGSDALIGITRVTEILQCGEVNKQEQAAFYEDIEDLRAQDVAVRVKDASFEWTSFELEQEEVDQMNNERAANKQDETEEIKRKLSTDKAAAAASMDPEELNEDLERAVFKGLHNINFDVAKGEFVVITGLIGSGKSSLLNALAGFMHKSAGSVKINGSLLLCGQPWIQNATVKDNILFGQEYDPIIYQDVIKACSLDSDLEILPAGDRTEIGERGITLSGGQKARISLARAVYADRDIILLDDVLSAVDARVGKHIMDECILGLLQYKTRILATHQLSLIGAANRVLFLNGDGSIEVGTVEELLASNAGFKSLMSFNADAASDEEDADLISNADEEEIDAAEAKEIELIRKQTAQSEKLDVEEGKIVDGVLMTKEDRAVNQIGLDVYKNYVKLGSGVFKGGIAPIFLTVIVLTAFCQIFTNVWLSFWTEEKFHGRAASFYMGLYAMFTFLTIIFAVCEFTLIVYITNSAARELNIKAVQKLLKAPMAFMDTTPMGRILNRFTKDTDALDNEISEQLRLFIYPLANVCGVVILCIIYLPWFAIAVPFLGFIFVSIAGIYQASGREVKRLEAIQRSFVYNNFNETLNGVLTIKAYKAESRFLTKNNFLINKMNEAYYITIANQRWLAIHLDAVAAVFCLIISLLSVFRVFNISAASVGVLVSYVIMIAGQLSLLIRAMTQVENEMNSVERLCHYAFELPQEAAFEISETKPRPEWPEHGAIDFEHVSLRYRPGLPLVLNDLSFDVSAGQKIGICGRTGAGKSSIMTALYRISELDQGSVIIDGVDIAKIGLRDLRSKLSIIPQDPVLLRGSVRKNLDPFNDHTDEWLWHSLHRSGLIEDIASVKAQTNSADMHKFHLDQVVEDDGANFSLGERQLIALTRAVVRNSKILILDEATSSVDYETDSKIQSTIVKEFGHCTILCIAHRLKTIIDYDKIMVLDRGELREFDRPWNLFNNKDTIFRSMCDKSNIVEDDFIRKD